MESSQFSSSPAHDGILKPLSTQGSTCDTFCVKLYGKLHFLKRLKTEHSNDIRYQEAFRKEFETGYRLEHPCLVRYISLSDDGILMEYIDGETLSQRLANQPNYFKDRKNADKFLRQLLDVVGYLHSHQVLHLDLKPDNILLTSINDDVKLIDLGCCYTDTFTDTTGRTDSFAAPEQLAGETVDARTDIYAVGRILELLPIFNIYNKVIARCTAADPSERYQSVEEIVKILSNQRKPYHKVITAALTIALIVLGIILWARHEEVAPVIDQKAQDTSTVTVVPPVTPQSPTSQMPVSSPVEHSLPNPSPQLSISVTMDVAEQTAQMEKELDRLLDSAYRSSIITFCDSVFPSLTVGRQWEKETSEFYAQALQSAAELSRKYPDIPESIIMQHVESRFQALVGYVFNRMRENGTKQ